ncbi:tetratricopeptide repeat protein [Treponema medium]|uniref:tetratricopeptide repeat protein n=1 Tax=Treponema medium TaxID=58231 RepID=UPI00197DAE8D|nr:tetratricopeptide repeat protein [Treponema medium]QSH92045.1 tetratricopeptide repeat protein [Treponema medium]
MSLYLISFISVLAFFILLLAFLLIRSIISPKKTAIIEKYINAGKYTTAIKRAKAIIAKKPRDTKAHYLLGKAYLADGRAELALMEFKTISKATFESTAQEKEFRSLLAQLYERFQQHTEALAEYALLIKLDPQNAEYYYAIGQLFEQLNKTEQAIFHYRQVISLNPKHAAAHAALGLLLFRNKLMSEAKQEIATALKLEPDNTTALYYQGRLLRETKEYAQALASFEKAARNADLRQKCFTERGLCYLDANSLEKAAFEFDRALKLTTAKNTSPDTLRLRYAAAACYEKMRDLDRAIEQWEIIHTVTPNYKDVADKLNQYRDLRSNDLMKEYLTVGAEAFLKLCKAVTEQAFALSVQSQKEIKQGCAIIALEDNSEKWMNVRKQPKLFIYSRDSDIIGDSFLRSLHEQMKAQGLVRGVVITSSGFSRAALSFAENRPFELIDKDKLESILKTIKGI